MDLKRNELKSDESKFWEEALSTQEKVSLSWLRRMSRSEVAESIAVQILERMCKNDYQNVIEVDSKLMCNEEIEVNYLNLCVKELCQKFSVPVDEIKTVHPCPSEAALLITIRILGFLDHAIPFKNDAEVKKFTTARNKLIALMDQAKKLGITEINTIIPHINERVQLASFERQIKGKIKVKSLEAIEKDPSVDSFHDKKLHKEVENFKKRIIKVRENCRKLKASFEENVYSGFKAVAKTKNKRLSDAGLQQVSSSMFRKNSEMSNENLELENKNLENDDIKNVPDFISGILSTHSNYKEDSTTSRVSLNIKSTSKDSKKETFLINHMEKERFGDKLTEEMLLSDELANRRCCEKVRNRKFRSPFEVKKYTSTAGPCKSSKGRLYDDEEQIEQFISAPELTENQAIEAQSECPPCMASSSFQPQRARVGGRKIWAYEFLFQLIALFVSISAVGYVTNLFNPGDIKTVMLTAGTEFLETQVARLVKVWSTPLLTTGALTYDFVRPKTKPDSEFFLLVKLGLLEFRRVSLFLLDLFQKYGWSRVLLIYHKDGCSNVAGEWTCKLFMESLVELFKASNNVTFDAYDLTRNPEESLEETIRREIFNYSKALKKNILKSGY